MMHLVTYAPNIAYNIYASGLRQLAPVSPYLQQSNQEKKNIITSVQPDEGGEVVHQQTGRNCLDQT